MNSKKQQATVNRIIALIDNDIIGSGSGFNDHEMIEALEEISSMCDGAVDAKREELRE